MTLALSGFGEALDIGTRRTQPFRDRATHLLQHSVEAAGWVSRSPVHRGGSGVCFRLTSG